MELKVDETMCVGCGACVAAYPQNFEFAENVSTVISNENATSDMVNVCPVGAISAVEGATEGAAEAPVEEEQIAA